MVASASSFRTRLLVLGASNVRRSLFPLIAMVFERFSGPIDLLFACGHGRSYCRPNRVMGWSLPGLCDAPWRSHWAIDDGAMRYGILTDVGNDLLYGVAPEALMQSVDRCFDAMQICHGAIVMGLPIERLKRITPTQFLIFKKIFFPGSTISLKFAISAAHEVDRCMREATIERHLKWLTPPSRWYGFDPIHIRSRSQREAWRSVLETLLASDPRAPFQAWQQADLGAGRQPGSVCSLSLGKRVRLVFSRAKQQSWMNWDQSQTQPVVHFDDGSCISFY